MTEETNEKILVKIKRKVGIITLNNGDMNVFSPEFLNLFINALKEYRDNKKVHSLIIQSASERAFSAGFDLKALMNVDHATIDIFFKVGQDIVEIIRYMPKPVIALINGHAHGVGLLFPLACDFRYCTEDATLSLPEANYSNLMFPTHGGCTNLPKIVRKMSDAKYILMTGDKFDAKSALEMGVVDKVFKTKEELLEKGFELAKNISSKHPDVIQLLKPAINACSQADVKTGMAIEEEAFTIIARTKDNKELKKKFIDKYMRSL